MENILIELDIDKEPYIKKLSNHKVINITGESGSGKSYYCEKWKNDENYIIVDTDIIFGTHEVKFDYEKELKEIFMNKYKENIKNALFNDFDICYEMILEYFKDSDKIIVIDSAQFRNMRDISKLKGEIIILRTSINKCYQRCIKRYKERIECIDQKKLEEYINKKKRMYQWYKSLNEFLLKIENYKI